MKSTVAQNNRSRNTITEDSHGSIDRLSMLWERGYLLQYVQNNGVFLLLIPEDASHNIVDDFAIPQCGITSRHTNQNKVKLIRQFN